MEIEARFEARLAAMRAELEAEYERRLAEKDAELEELRAKCSETQEDLDQLLLCLVRGEGEGRGWSRGKGGEGGLAVAGALCLDPHCRMKWTSCCCAWCEGEGGEGPPERGMIGGGVKGASLTTCVSKSQHRYRVQGRAGPKHEHRSLCLCAEPGDAQGQGKAKA